MIWPAKLKGKGSVLRSPFLYVLLRCYADLAKGTAPPCGALAAVDTEKNDRSRSIVSMLLRRLIVAALVSSDIAAFC